jgi:WD40 repeat protein
LVSGDKEGTVRFWSLEATNRAPSHEVLPEKVFAPPDNVIAFAEDGRTFLTVCQDGHVRVWSTQPVRELERLDALGTNNYALDFAADGRWLAVADRAGAVRIWDWPARRAVTNLTMPPVLGGILSFSPRGQFLWAGLVLTNGTRAGRTWETSTWRELPPPLIDFNGVVAASASPDEKLVATGYASGQIKLWSFPTGDLVAEPRAHTSGGVWLAFAPDGRTLASAAGDGFVQLWDVLDRRPLARFQAHRNAVRGPAFSADGRRLAVAGGSTEEALKLWDMATLRELIALPAEGFYCYRTAFSPDRNTLVAIDRNGVTHLWHAPAFAEIDALEKGKNLPVKQTDE